MTSMAVLPHKPSIGRVTSRRAPQCLIVQPLREMRRYASSGDRTSLLAEPRHPHGGVHLGEFLQQHGVTVFYLAAPTGNRVGWRDELTGILNRPDVDVVVTYSAKAAILARFLRLSGRRAQIVGFQFGLPNRALTGIRGALDRTIRAGAARAVDGLIYCLEELGPALEVATPGRLMTYAPTTVDTAFFAPHLASDRDAPKGVRPGHFLLSVGDAFRDDDFLRNALSGQAIPLVRVTRDPHALERANRTVDRQRGDIVLSNVSFESLRWLYSNCTAMVTAVVSGEHAASGSTAICEAIACGAPCIIAGSPVVEKEFVSLAAAAGVDQPLQVVDAGDAAGFRASVAAIVTLSASEKPANRASMREFAERVLPIERSYTAIADLILRVSAEAMRP